MIDYLNNTVWCTLKPSQYGIGVFAIRDIPKGTYITDYNDHVFYSKDLSELLPEIRELILDRYTFKDDGAPLMFYSPNYDQRIQSFLNHSDEPNTDGHQALRDIKKGEELTENYKDLLNGEKLHPLSKKHYTFLK